ncbi:hypothetical protein LEP1GSC170_6105 [Leptospira interrogans serovar Bataviae str. HAI135]|nr:hypothetical protein LEP1GSC170_6105 [Leptospira interrogans serovar Bataviae str. HAI135]
MKNSFSNPDHFKKKSLIAPKLSILNFYCKTLFQNKILWFLFI